MLFYLTSNDKVNLLDFVEEKTGLLPKKLTGRFSLMEFVVRDMRNYVHMRFFVIDRTAVTEDDGGLVEAVRAFRTMYTARIVVLCEGCAEHDALIAQLLDAGVTDLVTATDIPALRAEVLECLSPKGMRRYIVPQAEEPEAAAESGDTPAPERYEFRAKNIRIAVAGAQRRCGTTVTAVNLAHWISAHGGTACYVESNPHRHLEYIARLYAEEPEGSGRCTIGGVDYRFNDQLDRDYQFIVEDCGELDQTPQPAFAAADLRLLCGTAMPYELPCLQRAQERCGELAVQAVGVCVPEDIKLLLADSAGERIVFAKASHELFDGAANGELYLRLLEPYISNEM